MSDIRVVIVDDHPLFLDGLEQLLRLDPEIEVMARCSDGHAALAAVRLQRPDVLILDWVMPRVNGLSVLQAMKTEQLPTRAIVLTTELADLDMVEAIGHGVRGIVLKDMAPQLLLRCIHKVHQGGHWIEQKSVDRVLQKLAQQAPETRGRSGPLTPRELQVVRLAAAGLQNREIAQKLYITEGTVKLHLHRVYQKLEVGSRVELTLYAQHNGLL